ncbi:MAG: panB [Bacteriovoracaceae bacterium]|nr:panB [Bacteriovoracaceae bacterium]
MNSPKHIMVTCYDATFAKLIAETGAVDSVLVGDSLGMVIQGHDSTLSVSMDQIRYHVAAVARGLHKAKVEKKPLLIADMPVDSYNTIDSAIQNAKSLISVGAEMVKVEGAVSDRVAALKKEGIAVCGHIGLTPQSIQDFKVQGKTELEAQRLLREAKDLSNAGVDLLVLEMIPSSLAKKITESISTPTVGIGAGVYTSGQVLVLYDLLGLNPDFNPKFLKKFMNGAESVSHALKSYSDEVRAEVYPSEKNSFKDV